MQRRWTELLRTELLPGLLLSALLAGCAVAPDRGGDPFINGSTDTSTNDGVRRRFTICYNPFADPTYRRVIDRLVYEQCGRHVEPVNESAARCTLFHPSTMVYSCRLGGESQEPKEPKETQETESGRAKQNKSEKVR
jgi:hypothetical protein